jgi:hypothetical protein
MAFVLLIPRDLQNGNHWPQTVHSIYLSFSKIFFTFGIYLLVLPSLLGVKNMTFFLMDTRFFNFISKISFWTYLIHYMVVEKICFEQKIDFYYSPLTILPLYITIAVVSLFFGFLGTILI